MQLHIPRPRLYLLALVMLLAACAPQPVAETRAPAPTRTLQPAVTPTAASRPAPNPGSADAVLALRQNIANQLGLALNDVVLLEQTAQLWPDGCLGAAQPGEMCTMAIVPGFLVILDTPSGKIEVHTDQMMKSYRMVPLANSGSSPLVVWGRSGGIAGICWQMRIFTNGTYQILDCNTQQEMAKGSLPQQALDELNALAANMAPHEWATPPTQGADMFAEYYTWFGTGSQSPDARAQEKLNSYLGSLAGQLINQLAPLPAGGSSGIQGKALIGPTCGGPVRLDDPKCADQPYQATLDVLDAQGQLLASQQANADGTFRIVLPPGMYTLHPVTSGRLPTASDQTVLVLAGQFTTVDVHYDTGIR